MRLVYPFAFLSRTICLMLTLMLCLAFPAMAANAPTDLPGRDMIRYSVLQAGFSLELPALWQVLRGKTFTDAKARLERNAMPGVRLIFAAGIVDEQGRRGSLTVSLNGGADTVDDISIWTPEEVSRFCASWTRDLQGRGVMGEGVTCRRTIFPTLSGILVSGMRHTKDGVFITRAYTLFRDNMEIGFAFAFPEKSLTILAEQIAEQVMASVKFAQPQ